MSGQNTQTYSPLAAVRTAENEPNNKILGWKKQALRKKQPLLRLFLSASSLEHLGKRGKREQP